MTSQEKCEIYYSIPGDPFSIAEKDLEHIAHAPAILNIYTKEEEEIPNVTAVQEIPDVMTELSVPYPIKKGKFFNSESHCMILNEQGALLHIEDRYLFPVHMLRDGHDHERLHIKFNDPFFPGRHSWKKAGDDRTTSGH